MRKDTNMKTMNAPSAAMPSKSFLWRQRIGYGAADFACNLIWQMISLYLLYYYTDVANLDGLAIAAMFVVCRFIDGITDLLIGYAIDNTHTRWGKSRPYFLWGAVPFAIFAWLAFSVPAGLSETAKLVYCYVTYIGLSFMYTVVNIPMASILPALTEDAQERTNLATIRQFFSFLGSTLVSSAALFLVDRLGNGDEALGFRMVMLIFGILGTQIFFFTFFNVKEIAHQEKEQQKTTLRDALKSLAHNRPWIIFAVNILFMWGAYFLQSGALVYYYTSVIGSKELSFTIATIMSIVPVLSNLMVPALSKRMTKRNLYLLSAAVQIAGILLIWAAGMHTVLICFGAVIAALGYGAKQSIYFSMQADPVDYGIWKTGVDTSGSLSAVNGFLGKVAQAAAGGISGLLISWGGYIGGQQVQTANALLAIRCMYLYIPLVMNLISMGIMYFYRLDEIYPNIKKDLDLRKQNAAESTEPAGQQEKSAVLEQGNTLCLNAAEKSAAL